MTNYSPLYAALDESGEPVTPSDMVDAGYNDFEQGEYSIEARIIFALDALDGEIFDDPSKWLCVNQLVAALVEEDERTGYETQVTFSEGGDMTISFE